MVRESRQPTVRQPWHRNHRPPDPPWRAAGNYGIGVVSNVTSSFPLVCRRIVVHWRAIILLLILALATFLIAQADFFDLFICALFLIVIASQFFWIGRILDLGESFIPGKPRRAWLVIVAGLVYLFVFAYSFPSIESTSAHFFRAADYRLRRVLIEAAFWWWFVGSQVAILLVIVFRTMDRAVRATMWLYGKAHKAMQGHGAALTPGAIA